MEMNVALSYKSTLQLSHLSETLNVRYVIQYGLVRNGVYLAGCLMLTIDEAMKLFKVSRPTIYRWIKHYGVKSKVINGVRYFDIDGLQNAHESRHAK